MKARHVLPLVACLFASLALASPAASRVIRVHQGESIQEAIDSASPGDTILVAPGVYRENLTITTDHLTLLGSVGKGRHGKEFRWLGRGHRHHGHGHHGRTILEPAFEPLESPCTEAEGDVIEVNGICAAGEVDPLTGEPGEPIHGTKIAGFVVRGFSGFGVALFNASQSTVAHTKAKDNASYGISGFVLNGVRFLHDVAHDNGEPGFYIGDSPNADAVVKHNVAFRNGVGGGEGFGFLFRDSSHGVVSHNKAWGNCVGFVFADTGENPDPESDWRATKNLAVANDGACTGEEEGAPALSGIGVLALGTDSLFLAKNGVFKNVAGGDSVFSGGIVLVSGIPLGGADPTDNVIRKNRAFGNEPVDLFWDGSGTGNVFARNRCGTSDPDGLCH